MALQVLPIAADVGHVDRALTPSPVSQIARRGAPPEIHPGKVHDLIIRLDLAPPCHPWGRWVPASGARRSKHHFNLTTPKLVHQALEYPPEMRLASWVPHLGWLRLRLTRLWRWW